MAILKRALLLIGFLFACAKPIHSETLGIDTFGYLNNNESSPILDKTQAQDLLNVDIAPSGHSVKKRKGYGLYKTLSGSLALHGGYHFFDSSGNDVQIWGSSTSLWGIVSDGTPTQLVSSATLSSTWNCTDIAAFAYCVDSNRDALIKTNGQTITWYSQPSSNIGSIIIATPDRLVIAGSSTNPQTLYFSGSNNYTNFTTGILPTDPFPEIIAAPGSKITHLRYAFGRILWWKDQSFGYVLMTDQTNLQVVIVSNSIGTLDDSSAYFDNIVYWRAQDGQIYQYDGASLTLLSREISGTIALTNRKKSNFWTQTTQADFQTGSTSPTINVSLTNVPNSVVLTTNTAQLNNPSFDNSSGFENVTGWQISDSTTSTVRVFVSGISDQSICGAPSASQDGPNYLGYGAVGTGATSAVQIINVSSTVLASFALPTSAQCSWAIQSLIDIPHIGTTVMIRIAVTMGGLTSYLVSNQFSWPGEVSFAYKVDSASQRLPEFDNFIVQASTGSYYSSVHNAPSLGTWDTFNVTRADNGGTQAFYMRSSTNTFTTLSSTPSWTAITPGTVPQISTGTFFQVRDDLVTTTTSQAPILNDFTVAWFEGSASDKAYATYFQDAIWFAVSNGASATTNNRILRYDLINHGWGIYDIPSNGFVIQNTSLYIGDSAATGNIYKFGTGTSDNGAAITAYWKSKDFSGTDPFLENEYKDINIVTKTQTNETLTVTYTTNTSTSTAFSLPLTNSSDSLIRYKKFLPPGKLGGFFNIKLGDTSTGSAWEIYGIKVDFNPLTYRPS